MAADRSTWGDVLRGYPSTVVCRRMLRLADFAAADPARWGTCYLAHSCPELSFREIAAITGRTIATVQRHAAPVDLGDGGDYTAAELGVYPGDTMPRWTAIRAVTVDSAKLSPTYRRGCALADWAAASPTRWRVISYATRYPEETQEEIAEAMGVTQSTVCRALTPFSIDIDDDFNEIF